MPRTRVKLSTCLNCGTDLSAGENFCPNCGQENHKINRPLAHLSGELLAGIFNIDSRFFHTVKALFTNPGQLTKDFNAGKRRHYLPPIRIYLFASLIFFLFQSLSYSFQDADQMVVQEMQKHELQDSLHFNFITQTIYLTKQEINEIPSYSRTKMDTLLANKGMESTFINRRLMKKSAKIMQGSITPLVDELYQLMSFSMFFLMPVFAALLLFFYRKKGLFYIEHLIFSLNFYSAIFFILTLQAVTNFCLFAFPAIHKWISLLFYLLLVIYFIFSLKNVYEESWGKTLLKALGLSITNGLVTGIVMTGVAFLALLIF